MLVVMKITCNVLCNHLWIILNLKHMKYLKRILLNIHSIKRLFIKQFLQLGLNQKTKTGKCTKYNSIIISNYENELLLFENIKLYFNF